MMKRILAVTFMVMLMAGMAYAQSTSPTSAPNPQPGPAVEQPKETPADSQPQSSTQTRKAKLHFGPSVGIFNPTSGAVQDTFGSNLTRFGLRPFLTEVPERWRFMFDLSYYGMSNGDDSATLIPITAGFMKGLTQHKDMLTYVALNMGPYYARVDAPSIGVNKTGWGLNTNATVGVIFRQRWSLEGRYEFMNEFAGFDFSAFSISVGLRMFDISL